MLEKWALFCYAMDVSTYILRDASADDSFGYDPIIKEKRKKDGRFNAISKARNYSGSKD